MSQILLLLGNEVNQRLLHEWFAQQTCHDVRGIDVETPLAEPFDLCIVDGPGLEEFRQELHEYREERHPEFIPVLLLVPHEYSERLDETVWTYVDDIIWTSGGGRFDSLDTFEFHGRIRSLLRTHEMSRTLKENQQRLEVVHRILRHNVRNSINAIRGNAEIVAESGDVERADHVIRQSNQLLNHAEKARRMDEILDTDSQYEFELGEQVEQTVHEYREEYSDAEITIEEMTDIQVTAIHGISDALGELVENAIVHNSDDRPEVTVRVHAEDGWGVVSIADTGPEIPEQDRLILSGDQDPTAVAHGQGIGLWLVSWTVQRSDGTIDYEYPDQIGNQITVRLPAIA